MFRHALRIVGDLVGEIKAAVSRQLAEDLELAFAGIERGAHVICRKTLQINVRRCESLRRQLLETSVAEARAGIRH